MAGFNGIHMSAIQAPRLQGVFALSKVLFAVRGVCQYAEQVPMLKYFDPEPAEMSHRRWHVAESMNEVSKVPK